MRAAQSAGPGWIFVNFIMQRETNMLDMSSFFVIDDYEIEKQMPLA